MRADYWLLEERVRNVECGLAALRALWGCTQEALEDLARNQSPCVACDVDREFMVPGCPGCQKKEVKR